MYFPVCVAVMCSKKYTLVSPHLICWHCIKYFKNSVFPATFVCKEEQNQHHNNTILFNVYSKDALISPLDYFLAMQKQHHSGTILFNVHSKDALISLLTTQSGGYKCCKYCVLNYQIQCTYETQVTKTWLF